jgi:endonuclease YncB( thermonuclease family)
VISRQGIIAACLCALAAACVAAPAAHASFTAPCLHGAKHPRCTFWSARVTMVADGDTIKVVLAGDRSRTRRLIRLDGINAMELSHYSTRQRNRRGACHAVAAAGLVARYVKRSHWHVRLAAQHASSATGGRHRLRRSVWVKVRGHWTDLAKLELRAGLALWLPNGREWAHNLEYHVLAEEARVAQRGLYDPASCGYGPDQDLPIRVAVNWDANGPDSHHRNGEWVDVFNNGARPLRLGGWWLRDSWLRYGAHHVPGFRFPAGTVVAPGGAVRLHMGRGRDTARSFYWRRTRAVFENVTHNRKRMGDGAYLFDPQGDLRASSIYPCVVACHDPLRGLVRLRVRARGRESVTIRNVTGAPIDLEGQVLKLHVRGRNDHYVFGYAFGARSVIPPGARMRIVPGGSPRRDRPLLRHMGRRRHVLADRGGVLSLRTDSDLRTACASWGRAHC